jgi:hypothetical protein
MASPITSELKQEVFQSLLTSPGVNRMVVPISPNLPFRRLYFGRASSTGCNFHERIRINFLSRGSVVWSSTWIESNQDFATVTASSVFGFNVEDGGGLAPQWTVSSQLITSTVIPDTNPRDLMNVQNGLMATVRLLATASQDYLTRILCHPLQVNCVADQLVLTVEHDSGLTSPDISWNARAYVIGCHSSNTP